MVCNICLSLSQLSVANGVANVTLAEAIEAHDGAKEVADEVNSVMSDMSELLTSIGKLLGEQKATPDEVIAVSCVLLPYVCVLSVGVNVSFRKQLKL